MNDGYKLSKAYWDFAFENPEKISPNHAAIFFFAIEHCNRLGWKDKFGLPSQMVMDAIGIKKHSTYIRYFRDLIDWGFFDLIQKSQNQYSSNIIMFGNAMPKNGKALARAINLLCQKTAKHGVEHRDEHTAKQKEYNKTLELLNQEPNRESARAKKFIPPELPEVIEYFRENGYTDQIARKAFEHYAVAGWKDTTGKKVQNWKQKMRTVWFKDENRIEKIDQRLTKRGFVS